MKVILILIAVISCFSIIERAFVITKDKIRKRRNKRFLKKWYPSKTTK